MYKKLLANFLILIVLGCTHHHNTLTKKPISIIKNYWKNRLFGNNATYLYQMEWDKSRPPFKEYKNWVFAIQKFKIKKFEIVNMKKNNNKLYVKIKLYFFLPQMPFNSRKPFEQIIKDIWIFTPDGLKHVWQE